MGRARVSGRKWRNGMGWARVTGRVGEEVVVHVSRLWDDDTIILDGVVAWKWLAIASTQTACFEPILATRSLLPPPY